MSLSQLLFSLLTAGANLATSSAVTEFAKGAGKTAFEALKKRLAERHNVTTLPQLEEAAKTPASDSAIRAELEAPEIANDSELLRLAETLRAGVAALPSETQARFAVDIEEIRSGQALLFEAVGGVRAKTATAEGDMTFRNVTAPPGKP